MICYTFDDFRVDVASRSLSRGGVQLALTLRVFDTLLHLLARHGERVSKGELLQAVWLTRIVEENNLNQAVSDIAPGIGRTTRRASLRPDRARTWLPLRR